MRRSLAFALIAFSILVLLLAGCRSGGMPATTTTAEPAKAAETARAHEASAATTTTTTKTAAATVPGYDLYSWHFGGWHFSLLPGASELRSFDEIQRAGTSVEGVNALMSQLRNLPAGEKLRWSSRVAGTEMPDR